MRPIYPNWGGQPPTGFLPRWTSTDEANLARRVKARAPSHGMVPRWTAEDEANLARRVRRMAGKP